MQHKPSRKISLSLSVKSSKFNEIPKSEFESEIAKRNILKPSVSQLLERRLILMVLNLTNPVVAVDSTLFSQVT